MDASIFPLTFEKHILFGILACLFFLLQFWRTRNWYELVLAAAMPLSLLIYVSEEKAWFYSIGILEGLLLIAAFVLAQWQARRRKAAAAAESTPSPTDADAPKEAET